MKRSHGAQESKKNEVVILGGGRRGFLAWPATAGVCGVGGGIAAGLIGSLMLAGAWLTGHHDGGFSIYGIGSALLISTIPLVMLGAYCLDLSERREAEQGLNHRDSEPEGNTGGYKHPELAGLFVITLIIFAFSTTQAQQTVFNVPTTDVLDRGKVYFELDISAKPNNSDALNRFSSFVPRVVVGTGGRIEVGLDLTGNIQPGADTTTLIPAVKWRIYDGKDNGWAIAVGDNLFIPVRNKSYDVGAYAYTMVQKTFTTKTRVGFGAYFFSKNVVAPNATRAGGQFTFEQPVTERFGVGADWFTGKHANGLFTSGGYYKFTKKLTTCAAYSVGNAKVTKGNHFLYFELGYNFN